MAVADGCFVHSGGFLVVLLLRPEESMLCSPQSCGWEVGLGGTWATLGRGLESLDLAASCSNQPQMVDT